MFLDLVVEVEQNKSVIQELQQRVEMAATELHTIFREQMHIMRAEVAVLKVILELLDMEDWVVVVALFQMVDRV